MPTLRAEFALFPEIQIVIVFALHYLFNAVLRDDKGILYEFIDFSLVQTQVEDDLRMAVLLENLFLVEALTVELDDVFPPHVQAAYL